MKTVINFEAERTLYGINRLRRGMALLVVVLALAAGAAADQGLLFLAYPVIAVAAIAFNVYLDLNKQLMRHLMPEKESLENG